MPTAQRYNIIKQAFRQYKKSNRWNSECFTAHGSVDKILVRVEKVYKLST